MDKQELQTVWSTITEAVKAQPGINAGQIDSFFSHLKLQDMIPGFCMITAESLPMKQWVDQYYLLAIEQAFSDLYGTQLTVMTAVETPSPNTTSNTQTTSPIPTCAPAAAHTTPDEEATSPQSTTNSGALTLPEIHPHETSAGTVINPLHSQGTVAVPNPLVETPTKPIFSKLTSLGDLPNPFAQTNPTQKGSDAKVLNIPPIETQPESSSSAEDEVLTTKAFEIPFVSTMTFENFVVGDNNRLARDTALKVAENPGRNPMLNPIFIYGKSGLGKTHLMHAIRNEVCKNHPELKTEYVDAMTLVSDYTDARIDNDKDKRSYRTFRERYMNADVLLIDDIQNLQGKVETLNMVFQIFNHCIDHGHQVVLSSDRAPKYIEADERLMSRFNGGGVWDIQPYSTETRMAIIRQYLSDPSMAQISGGTTLNQEIQEYLASIAGSNVRDLRSAVLKVLSAQTSLGRDIKKTEVDNLLHEHFSNGATKPITPDDVVKEVALFYNVKADDLRSDTRERSILYPRQVAMFLMRDMLNLTLEKIGEHFNRNHTSVRHSIEKIANDKRNNIELAGDLETLETRIREA